MKLSIITVNYNNRGGLQRTIDSVVSQTWRDFEWIIIDGGSTDGSKELIEQYQNHFAYWCSEPDKGIYNAMNKGIDKAKGEYLNFMNSGDCFYEKDTLEKVLNHGLHADIVYGDFTKHGIPAYHYKENIMLQLYEKSINHQSTFIKRYLLANYRYDEKYKIVSDWKFWLQTIILDNVSIEYIDIIVSNNEDWGASVSSENVPERFQVFDELFPHRVIEALELLHQYESSRPVQRAKRLVGMGGFAEKITRGVLKFLDRCFLRIDFTKE